MILLRDAVDASRRSEEQEQRERPVSHAGGWRRLLGGSVRSRFDRLLTRARDERVAKVLPTNRPSSAGAPLKKFMSDKQTDYYVRLF